MTSPDAQHEGDSTPLIERAARALNTPSGMLKVKALDVLALNGELVTLREAVVEYLSVERRLRAHEASCTSNPCQVCEGWCDTVLDAEGDLRTAAGWTPVQEPQCGRSTAP